MKYFYSPNLLIRVIASFVLIAVITAIAVISTGCACESYDSDGNPVENCPPAAI